MGAGAAGLVAGSVVVAVALVAIVAATRLGGNGKDTAVTSGETTPSTVPETTPPTAAVTAPPRDLPSDTVPLAAGTWTSSRFTPRLTMTIDGSWTVVFPDHPEFLQLAQSDGTVGGLSFVRLNQVLDPGRTYLTTDDLDTEGGLQPRPDDVAAWLAANPRLSVSPPAPVSAAAVNGVQVDVDVRSAYESELCNQGECVPLWPFDDATLGRGVVRPDNLYRIYTLDVEGQKVLVILVADADNYGRLLTEADRVLSSLTFSR